MGSDKAQGAPPPPPSVGSGISDYIENYPRLIEAQEKYGARDLESQRAAQAQAYPELEQLRSTLMGQVQQGIGEDAPDWYANQLSDTIKSQFGRNAVFNPLGQQQYAAEYQGGMKNWQDYWRNMAASFSGSQPVYQTQSGAAGFTPQGVMANNMQGYSSMLPAWSQQQGRMQTQSMYNQQMPWQALQGAGNMIGGLGSMMPRTSNINYSYKP